MQTNALRKEVKELKGFSEHHMECIKIIEENIFMRFLMHYHII